MNKVKKAIRSLNPVVRMTIIAAVICVASGLFFGSVLGINSASALFALTLAATFFVVGVYVRFIEDDDE